MLYLTCAGADEKPLVFAGRNAHTPFLSAAALIDFDVEWLYGEKQGNYLYCDISAGSGSNAMMRDPEFTAKFITEFSDRIYYGADVCAPTQTFQYDFLAYLENLCNTNCISQEDYEKVMYKNAEKLRLIGKAG